MQQSPEDPAYAVKYAGMAGENWAELKLRATQVLKSYPHLIFGYAMLARALSELGEKEAARRMTRRGLRRFPRDVELGTYAFHQAVASGHNRTALRIIRRLRLEHNDAGWMYATEVDLLIRLKRFADAERALNEADKYLTDDQVINESWAKLEAAVAQPA
jgi:predicted Zn-dependent protease